MKTRTELVSDNKEARLMLAHVRSAVNTTIKELPVGLVGPASLLMAIARDISRFLEGESDEAA